jgi:GT2 family glycosyltransferase
MTHRIATVIVNWNKKSEVVNLLNSLTKTIEPLFDIFLVDNASTDGSIETVDDLFPDIFILKNKTNLGGTGGFNTGIKYICELKKYDYIWLLDNDVEVTASTLCELVKILESDNSIGLVGSHIFDIDNRDVTVEMGGNIRWDTIGTIPVYRNTTGNITESTTVDYVAICSALVRTKVLDIVGLMDDRLFLLWDDMDWGLCFNEHGYKVVSAANSIVYHGSFTERNRGAVTNFYYGIRNPLLVYAKHTTFIKRITIYYRSIRYLLKTFLFLIFQKKYWEANLIYHALADFMNNRWGKLSKYNSSQPRDMKLVTIANFPIKSNKIKILLSSFGITSKECISVIAPLKEKFPMSEITILTHDDRSEYFNQYVLHILKRSKLHNLLYVLMKSIKIFREKYDAIAFIVPTPYMYFVPYSILLNADGMILMIKKTTLLSLLKVFSLLFFSEVISFLILPFLLYKSSQYKRSKIGG